MSGEQIMTMITTTAITPQKEVKEKLSEIKMLMEQTYEMIEADHNHETAFWINLSCNTIAATPPQLTSSTIENLVDRLGDWLT